jgi:N-acetylglutamate synthase
LLACDRLERIRRQIFAAMIRYIEELALNAWPSLQPLLLDGSVVRFANGYTRRANSMNP